LGSIFLFSFAAFPLTDRVLHFLTRPNDHLEHPAKLIFLKPAGMLMVRMEVALAMGLVISFPVVFYQTWKFIAPGLLSKEKKFIIPVIVFTFFCFFIGSAFAYLIIIPMMLSFLFSMGTSSIEANINITEYIGFILRMILFSGAIFELPVLSFILSRVGILTPRFMKKYRRHAVIMIMILAAIITPTTDPVNLFISTIPLVILYEISIWISILSQRKPHQKNP
jgi:sec-independent protein translocase protein TatC